jgi:hypothetical protein
MFFKVDVYNYVIIIIVKCSFQEKPVSPDSPHFIVRFPNGVDISSVEVTITDSNGVSLISDVIVEEFATESCIHPQTTRKISFRFLSLRF